MWRMFKRGRRGGGWVVRWGGEGKMGWGGEGGVGLGGNDTLHLESHGRVSLWLSRAQDKRGRVGGAVSRPHRRLG